MVPMSHRGGEEGARPMAHHVESTEEKSPRWKLLAAALVVGVVVAMGVILSVRGFTGDDADSTTAAPSSAPTDTNDSVCGLPGNENSGSLSAAPTATWTLIADFAVPATKAGPGVVQEDGLRHCYAHTPEGVVLAAANFAGMDRDPTRTAQVADKLIAPGPGREIRRQASEETTATTTPDPLRLQIAGVQVITYSGSASTVDLLMRGTDGKYVAQQFEMVWAEGDWRLAISDDGQLKSEPRSVPDATGHLPWSDT